MNGSTNDTSAGITKEDLEVAYDLFHLEKEEPVGHSGTFRAVVADLETIATLVGAEGDL